MRITVPGGIDFCGIAGRKLADKAAHFLHTVFGKYAIRNGKKKADEDPDMVPVSSRVSEKLYGKDGYGEIRRSLLDSGTLVTDNRYRTKDHPLGPKCKCYAPGHGAEWDVEWHEIEDDQLASDTSRPRADASRLEEHDRQMLEHLDSLSYHPAAVGVAGKTGESLMRRYGQLTVLNRIDRGEHVYSIGPVNGRVTNTLCGASRSVRKWMRIDGLPATSVDLSCCQPALLGAMLNSHGPIQGFLESRGVSLSIRGTHGFAQSAADGTLYRELVLESGLSPPKAKKAFMYTILAKRDRGSEELEAAFGRLFPEVLHFIREFTADDHARLIILLQQAESWLVRNFITPRVAGRFPVVTVYDAVFCPITYETELLGEVQAGLEDAGVAMRAKIEIPNIPGLEHYEPR